MFILLVKSEGAEGGMDSSSGLPGIAAPPVFPTDGGYRTLCVFFMFIHFVSEAASAQDSYQRIRCLFDEQQQLNTSSCVYEGEVIWWVGSFRKVHTSLFAALYNGVGVRLGSHIFYLLDGLVHHKVSEIEITQDLFAWCHYSLLTAVVVRCFSLYTKKLWRMS